MREVLTDYEVRQTIVNDGIEHLRNIEARGVKLTPEQRRGRFVDYIDEHLVGSGILRLTRRLPDGEFDLTELAPTAQLLASFEATMETSGELELEPHRLFEGGLSPTSKRARLFGLSFIKHYLEKIEDEFARSRWPGINADKGETNE